MDQPGSGAARTTDPAAVEPPAGRFAALTVFFAWAAFLACVVYLAGATMNAPPPWRAAVANWDAGYYLGIAEVGYATEVGPDTSLAFFPAYPLVLRALSELGLDPVVGGTIASLTFFLAALVLLQRLLAERFSPGVARNALLLVAFWPFSFFFGVVYTESLFLLLAVAAFFLADRQRWWAAAACAGVAGATRATGVAIALGVLLAFIQSDSWQLTRRNLVRVAGLATLALSGLAGFMGYLWEHTGDPLAFLEAQRFWPHRDRGISGLSWIGEVLTTHPVASYEYSGALVYLVPAVLFAALSIYVLLRVDAAWGAFCLITVLAPVPTGSLASTNRYVLVLFPCFAALAALLKERAAVAVGVSAGLLGLFAYHYVFHPRVFIG